MKTMKRKKIELLRKSHRQPTIDFIRIREGAQIPARATRDAAGYDLSSAESCTVPSGGRVLGITAVRDTLEEAVRAAYAAAERVHFDEKYSRSDIGLSALRESRLKNG